MLNLTTGCRLTQPAPVKQQFWLELNRPASSPMDIGETVLQIRPIRVAGPFDQKSFVYRLSEVEYEADFYHEFFAPPGLLLTEQTRRWIELSGLFRTVLSPSSQIAADFQLEGQATELLGDFQNPASPKAILALQFWLIDHPAGPSAIRFHKDYRAAIPLTNRTPDTLARGWSQALQNILAQLEADLKTHTRQRQPP